MQHKPQTTYSHTTTANRNTQYARTHTRLFLLCGAQ